MEDERERDCSSSPSSSSLRHKLRSSLCLSCCFRSGRHETLDQQHHQEHERQTQTPRLIRGLRSRAAHEFPEFKDKCRNLFCRIGKGRRHSADFRYDPLSYALNFDEGFDESHGDEFPLKNFSARLPSSPLPQQTRVSSPSSSSSSSSPLGKGAAAASSPTVVVPREIAAFS